MLFELILSVCLVVLTEREIFIMKEMRIFAVRHFHKREREEGILLLDLSAKPVSPRQNGGNGEGGESDIKREGSKMEVVGESFINPLRRIQSVLISCRAQKNYSGRRC